MYMKKTQKGVTLVEVIVAIAVFATISLALFSSVMIMKNVIKRQEEYVKIEMVCYDIKAYCEQYDENWMVKYFEGCNIDTKQNIGYLSSDFKPTTYDNAKYIIKYTKESIVYISTLDGKVTFVENVSLTK